jgi:hypothetical protein
MKLLKIQALAAEFVKLKLLILMSLLVYEQRVCSWVENILKVALAAKKEEMASIQKMQQALIRLKKKFLSYKLR